MLSLIRPLHQSCGYVRGRTSKDYELAPAASDNGSAYCQQFVFWQFCMRAAHPKLSATLFPGNMCRAGAGLVGELIRPPASAPV